MSKKFAFAALAVALVVTGCGGAAQAGGGAKLALDAPLPTTVPDGAKIVVGDPSTEVALKLSGQFDKVSKYVQFANLSGGPQTTEAFRAKALDLGAVAEIPSIHATWTGLKVKIVASKFRLDAINHPIYELGIAPGVSVTSLGDLRGKSIAFSPGQAQGALVLKVLKKAGLTKEDVKLIELPSTGDVYSNALAAKQVDVAPIGGVQIKRYTAKYGKDGATTLQHGIRDDAGHLYGPTESLEDPAKAAAIRAYVAAWGVAQEWIDKHPKEWIAGYYVKDQGLTEADGEWLVENAGHPEITADWSDAIERQQETIELLAPETNNPVIQAADLYDLRFQSVAADAIKAGAAK
ncbi:ABC transporter substrate-binding protein [Kribbella sandramycini]|uniref:ABC transporter substrate-binding protein n=1 Tax=Kribbella sandramycini TaxID=60450 RepID=A0A7Y4NZV4_9ACTN|nr:ABC transporter substrate-binding protein [Kribbella sandramycini]MBB6565729.1 sulfonate transport system substrate-binding protein [Kribbella sandramycini]NOL41991.1 ABC transporter substrate-binding protein [Kribbella sandramycini]